MVNSKALEVTNKDDITKKKKKIQEKFREKLGLHIDVVKQGKGTTSDGNTSRRFIENFELSAQITGLNKTLLKNLYIILQAVVSEYEINIGAFRKYAMETTKLFVKLYPWGDMTPRLF